MLVILSIAFRRQSIEKRSTAVVEATSNVPFLPTSERSDKVVRNTQVPTQSKEISKANNDEEVELLEESTSDQNISCDLPEQAEKVEGKEEIIEDSPAEQKDDRLPSSDKSKEQTIEDYDIHPVVQRAKIEKD